MRPWPQGRRPRHLAGRLTDAVSVAAIGWHCGVRLHRARPLRFCSAAAGLKAHLPLVQKMKPLQQQQTETAGQLSNKGVGVPRPRACCPSDEGAERRHTQPLSSSTRCQGKQEPPAGQTQQCGCRAPRALPHLVSIATPVLQTRSPMYQLMNEDLPGGRGEGGQQSMVRRRRCLGRLPGRCALLMPRDAQPHMPRDKDRRPQPPGVCSPKRPRARAPALWLPMIMTEIFLRGLRISLPRFSAGWLAIDSRPTPPARCLPSPGPCGRPDSYRAVICGARARARAGVKRCPWGIVAVGAVPFAQCGCIFVQCGAQLTGVGCGRCAGAHFACGCHARERTCFKTFWDASASCSDAIAVRASVLHAHPPPGRCTGANASGAYSAPPCGLLARATRHVSQNAPWDPPLEVYARVVRCRLCCL